MNVTLARATRADLPQLLEWRRQMWCTDALQSSDAMRANAERAMEHLIIGETVGRLWIIRSEAQPVGFIALVFSFSLELGGRMAFIDELFIEENFRGKGIGRRTVQLVIDEARQLDMRNLMLEVNELNLPARRIYEKAGFTDRRYRLMTKWLGEEAQ
jgi:GNAT superfamily N-acetyltransferase